MILLHYLRIFKFWRNLICIQLSKIIEMLDNISIKESTNQLFLALFKVFSILKLALKIKIIY